MYGSSSYLSSGARAVDGRQWCVCAFGSALLINLDYRRGRFGIGGNILLRQLKRFLEQSITRQMNQVP